MSEGSPTVNCGVEPMPPIHRSSMASQTWAGHPLWRPVARLLKVRAPRTWDNGHADRHFQEVRQPRDRAPQK